MLHNLEIIFANAGRTAHAQLPNMAIPGMPAIPGLEMFTPIALWTRRPLLVYNTGRTVADTRSIVSARQLPEGAIHQFAPIDMPQYVQRFLRHWRPDLALFVESDLWQNLILGSAQRSIPLILLVLLFQKRIVAGLTAGAVKG